MAREFSQSKALMKTRNVSVWRQISDMLVSDIKQGVLQGGARLPTDIELAQRFGCNKHTARRAVAHLEQEGLVRVEWGRGTFVVEGAPDQRDGAQARLVHSLLDQHRNLRNKFVRMETLPAAAPVARGLRIALGSPCLQLILLNQAGDAPLSLGLNYFPLKRLPPLAQAVEKLSRDLEAPQEFNSIAAVLRTAGIKKHRRSRIRIGARLPSTEEAAQLRMARQQPLLETESIDVDERDSPVLYAKTCFRADRLQLVVPTS